MAAAGADTALIAVGLVVIVLFGGFALKGQCLQPWDGRQYSRLCYNDIQALYSGRGIEDHVFPYVHGDLQAGDLVSGAIEYPVGTGVFMWASGLPTSDANQYLRASALALTPFALVAAYLLARMTGWRALLFAAAPAVVLYAFHNWDLVVVATAIAGFWAWTRRRHGWAAVLFGMGAAFKLYPGVFLLPLALERLFASDRRGAAASVGAGLGTFALINVPFALANPDGWLATYAFHRQRAPNFDNIWMWTPGFDFGANPALLNVVTGGLVAAFFGAAFVYGVVRARREGVYPFLAVSGALLVAFLLWNKVHSPQYTLWLLPFFALLSVNVAWWAAYAVVDLVVYVGVFRWFYDFAYQGANETLARQAMIAGVWARAALLLVLFGLFLRARAAAHPEAVPEKVSEPIASLHGAGEHLPAQG